jgi:hypothetical protein
MRFGHDRVKVHYEAFIAKVQKHKRSVLMIKYVLSTVLMVLIALMGGVARADDAHVMTKEQLLPLLGKSDVIIIDVSSNEGWDGRDRKIPGALREEPMKFDSWMKKYPKDKTIVLYCS